MCWCLESEYCGVLVMEGRGLKFLRDSSISYRTEQSYKATQIQYRATEYSAAELDTIAKRTDADARVRVGGNGAY